MELNDMSIGDTLTSFSFLFQLSYLSSFISYILLKQTDIKEIDTITLIPLKHSYIPPILHTMISMWQSFTDMIEREGWMTSPCHHTQQQYPKEPSYEDEWGLNNPYHLIE